MINAITRNDAPPKITSTATKAPATPAPATPASTAFGAELSGQLALPDVRALFDSTYQAAASSTSTAQQTTAAADATSATQTAASTDPPTAQSVFGDQPWIQDPQGTGPDSTSWSYNPIYFATDATAQQVASMVGGTVIQQEVMTPVSGPFEQSQPNEMVQLANGSVVNPGLIADFYDHGYSQSFVNQMIQNEIKGV